MNKNLFVSTAVALGLLGSTAAKADELPSCFSGPVRQDDAWQKWYATNNCPYTFKLYYSQRDTTGSVSRHTPAISPACSARSLIVETFKENVVQFGSIEWQSTGLKSCSNNQGAASPTPNTLAPMPTPFQMPNLPSMSWNPTELFDPENKTPDAFKADVRFCRQSAQSQSSQRQADQVWDQCMRSRGNRTSQELVDDINACSSQAVQNFMGRPKQAEYAYSVCLRSHGWGALEDKRMALTNSSLYSLKAAADQEAVDLDRQHRAEVQQQIDQENARNQNNNNDGNAISSFLQDFTGALGAIRSAPQYAPSPPTYTPRGGNCRPPAQACR
jgi:hypothetical protein